MNDPLVNPNEFHQDFTGRLGSVGRFKKRQGGGASPEALGCRCGFVFELPLEGVN